jgi:predicted DCC family thiol-disulfide oxidoreductase YuxK
MHCDIPKDIPKDTPKDIPNDMPRDTLHYDGNCPLCMREVRLLRRIARPGLALVDLNEVPEQPGQPTRQTRLTTLHLLTAEGKWLTGVDATVRAWSHTRWGFLFRILRWPLIGPLADAAYRYWARKRYQRLYGCSSCVD